MRKRPPLDPKLAIPSERRVVLTPQERQTLHAERYEAHQREVLAWLEVPFVTTLTTQVSKSRSPRHLARRGEEAFLLCRQMMRDLDMTYWGFTWERLLPWRNRWQQSHAHLARKARITRRCLWISVTKTLLVLGVLPYSEQICYRNHVQPAVLWLGRTTADEIRGAVLQAGRAMGYSPKDLVPAVKFLLCILAWAQKRSLADLTWADCQGWQAWTTRRGRETHIPQTLFKLCKILVGMGHLPPQVLPAVRPGAAHWFNWGTTPAPMREGFERYLADVQLVYRPPTLVGYRSCLRRFGAWMSQHFPAVICFRQVQRQHIEAYKQALATMKCGEYVSSDHGNSTSHGGQLLSKVQQARQLIVLRGFFQHIELLEYPDRPPRLLWGRRDLPKPDDPPIRIIPDEDWHRLRYVVDHLDAPQIRHGQYPPTYLHAMLTVLFECGLRGSELCRLDLGCLIVATDGSQAEKTYWLRVPVGKLHQDRIIPVSLTVVRTLDAWIAVRGPQPALLDQRTGKHVDFLFTHRGTRLRFDVLNRIIGDLCRLAGTRRRYTSHCFRHTLATRWRNQGMRLEMISKMLGHKSLDMTLRYSAVMSPTLRQEFEEAFAAIAEEYRTVAQVRVVLSPEAHLEAQKHWREAMWVDLGIGWCGLSAYLPCESRLKCQRCPNFIPESERLPLLETQRQHLVELKGLRELPSARKAELEQAIGTVEGNIAVIRGTLPKGPCE